MYLNAVFDHSCNANARILLILTRCRNNQPVSKVILCSRALPFNIKTSHEEQKNTHIPSDAVFRRTRSRHRHISHR